MAVDILLEIDGIKGESKIDKHEEWIDILSWSWGMSQSGNAHLGGGAGAGKANFQDLSFVHYVDKATPTLMLKLAQGKHLPKATLKVRKAGEEPVDYLVITMEKVFITSLTTGGNGGEDRLTENFSMSFESVKVEYQEQDSTGMGTPAPEFSWTIQGNTSA